MSGRVAAIHQPNYLPWIGYFHKILRSDIFIFLDDSEYSSGSWMNRNRIKTPDGWTWLTVPVRDSSVPIREVRIANQNNWSEEHWKSLTHNYGGAPYFEEWRPYLADVYDKEWERLYPLNFHLSEEICNELGVAYEFVEASTFDISGTGSERLAKLCDAVDADRYLCGMGADGYMSESDFEERGIAVAYQDFEYPTYDQRFGEFIPNLSFIDVLMNVGRNTAVEMLRSL